MWQEDVWILFYDHRTNEEEGCATEEETSIKDL